MTAGDLYFMYLVGANIHMKQKYHLCYQGWKRQLYHENEYISGEKKQALQSPPQISDSAVLDYIQHHIVYIVLSTLVFWKVFERNVMHHGKVNIFKLWAGKKTVR